MTDLNDDKGLVERLLALVVVDFGRPADTRQALNRLVATMSEAAVAIERLTRELDEARDEARGHLKALAQPRAGLRGVRCEAEAALALMAKERLRALLAGPVEIARGEPSTGRKRDRFGRTLGAIRRLDAAPGLPAGDVAQDLLKRGLAERWEPGRAAKERRRAFWCGR